MNTSFKGVCPSKIGLNGDPILLDRSSTLTSIHMQSLERSIQGSKLDPVKNRVVMSRGLTDSEKSWISGCETSMKSFQVHQRPSSTNFNLSSFSCMQVFEISNNLDHAIKMEIFSKDHVSEVMIFINRNNLAAFQAMKLTVKLPQRSKQHSKPQSDYTASWQGQCKNRVTAKHQSIRKLHHHTCVC